jgi:putative spermidine/putrescine transport system permease protein
MMNGNKRVFLIIVPFALLMTFFFLVPLIYMLVSSFSNSEGITFEHYQEVLTNSYILQGFKNSLILSLVSALIALSASLLGVYAMTSFSEKVRERLLVISNLTSNFSGVPLAFAFIVLLGNSGLFTLTMEKFGWDLSFSLYSWSGLLLIYIYFQLPLAVMLLYPIYYGIQMQWKEAAALLGASTFMFWKKIGLPIIFPGVIGTFTILFANAFGAYASAYALTGSNYNLAAIRIGALIQGDIFAQPELASAIAVLLGVIMIVGMLLNEWLIKKTRKDLSGR